MADFASIAPYYDLMTDHSQRLVRDFGVIKHLVEKFGVKTALDAGCGTGVHSIILTKMGVDVIGIDSSAEMLAIAHTNALKEGVEPPFEVEYFEALPDKWSEKFDAVFCLANSLVGVEKGERLILALKSFKRVLKSGGRAIIQVLNFDNYRRRDRRIIKVSSHQNFTFVRFFDFAEDETRLNVIVIKHDLGQVTHEFFSQRILPLNKEILSIAARAGHFSTVEFFSDLTLAHPYSSDGDDLVAVLTK